MTAANSALDNDSKADGNTQGDGIVVLPDSDSDKPTTLKPVIDVIPDHCYQRSTARGLLLIGRDLVVYSLALLGLASTDRFYLLIPLWLLAGLSVAGLFVLGHDAAHLALFDSRRLNSVMARLTMLPSLHATEPWVFGHNRVHHGHTLRQGMDFVWHPITAEEFLEMSRAARIRHRLEWSFLGAGAYYTREIWFNKMVVFKPAERWRRAFRRDQAIVAVFTLVFVVGSVILAGPAVGTWLIFKMLVVPFLLFNQIIGWVVYVHHISPEIRWWPRREWNRFRGQVEGTTVLTGPPGWELFFHWIMTHLPHHVDARIPCYRLSEAAAAVGSEFPEDVVAKPIQLRDYLSSTRACKVHNFQTGEWSRYPTGPFG